MFSKFDLDNASVKMLRTSMKRRLLHCTCQFTYLQEVDKQLFVRDKVGIKQQRHHIIC